MKRFLMAIALTCALSSGAFAGEIPSTDTPVPPPPSPLVTIIIAVITTVAG